MAAHLFGSQVGLALLRRLFGAGNTKSVRPITAWGAESEAGLPWRQSCDGSVLEGNNGCCCWRTAVFRLGFGRDSLRLEVNIFFEKRTKNGTEVFPRKTTTFFVALIGCSAILLRAEGTWKTTVYPTHTANGAAPDPTSFWCGSGLPGYIWTTFWLKCV